jgi:hypothetical protein
MTAGKKLGLVAAGRLSLWKERGRVRILQGNRADEPQPLT